MRSFNYPMFWRQSTMNRSYLLCGVMALWLLCAGADALAETMRNMPSFQGYTGLLNTPNALTADEGTIFAAFADHRENDRLQLDGADNYLFSVGLLPLIEIGGRFTEEHTSSLNIARRDLSAHAKLQIPRIFASRLLPQIALGIQDPGGGSTFFQTDYLVFSHDLYPLRLSWGYGFGPDRMKGLFGGLECQLFDWCQLLGEYDTEETNFGLRLLSPESWFSSGMRLGAVGKLSSRDDYQHLDFALSAVFPLGGLGSKTPDIKSGPDLSPGRHEIPSPNPSPNLPLEADSKAAPALFPQDLIQRLGEFGLENIVVKTATDGSVSVEYENNRYNHNELDGLGLVMGIADAMLPEDCPQLWITVKEVNVPLLELAVSKPALSRFFQQNGTVHDFSAALKINPAAGFFSTFMAETRKKTHFSSMLKLRLSVYPGLRTYIGTEYGAFDYLVSARPDLRVDLWPGGMMGVIWDVPVIWSNNFDDGAPFRSYRREARAENVMLHQTFKPLSQVASMFSVGKLFGDNTGVMNETFWLPGSGVHRLSLKAGIFKDDDHVKRQVCIGAYRYYHAPLDLSLEAKYGQYWNQDKGFLVKIKRYFRDTAVYLFYRHVGENSGDQAAGIGFSLPLTPKQDMKPGIFQVKGANRWAYEQQVAVAESGQPNPLHLNLAVVPNTGHGLENLYFDDDRLHEAYIRRHLERLRFAYLTWSAR